MWYDLGLYMAGASLAIVESIKGNSWGLLERNPKLSLWISGLGILSSVLGGFFGFWRYASGAGGEGLWAAIVAFVVLCIANTLAFAYKYEAFARKKRIRDLLKTESGSTLESYLKAGNINGLKDLLEEDPPGTCIDESLLDKVMQHRNATIPELVISLEKVRIKTSLTSSDACMAAMEEVLPIFLATHCIKALMPKENGNGSSGNGNGNRPMTRARSREASGSNGGVGVINLRSHVIDHLAVLAIIISGNDAFQNIAFEHNLSHWELPCKVITTQRHPFSALDFNTMTLKASSKGNRHQCKRCGLFWSGKWWEIRKTTCRVCRVFAISPLKEFFAFFKSKFSNPPPQARAESAYELHSV